ncbi:uncharacterized protein LODBEIA_P44510 [Lodderomyces beijingensis]|uniref:Uncharacterized protein n=1 Tax=Lodderomyces beijingensis TaxID=1775926 RepID=A0ABP0ZQ19_9ASCO
MLITKRYKQRLLIFTGASIIALLYFIFSGDFTHLLSRLSLSNFQAVADKTIIPSGFIHSEAEIAASVNSGKQRGWKIWQGSHFKQAQYEDPSLSPKRARYHAVNFTLFNSKKDIGLDLDNCKSLQEEKSVYVDRAQDMKSDMHEILTKVLYDLESEKSEYFNDLKPFILPELKLQLMLNVVDRFWYRIAGSSVWLQDFGVHYMISRILYSPKGVRNQPIISLTYAQIYDKDWKEIVGARLIVPPLKQGDPEADEDTDEGTILRFMKFPHFVKIPFWHDIDHLDGRYYGPEDPRLILVKNSRGYDEPLIVYNSFYGVMEPFDDDEDSKSPKQYDFYRSLFMCWPWQFEEDGKYVKTVGLKIENAETLKIQKNWTPFISHIARKETGYDTHIRFVNRWANLDVLKCDFDGNCQFEYRLDEKLSLKNQIGPLRGGTQLFNLHSILPEHLKANKEREIYVGFARAHLDNCGCGSVMYRPNLVIVVRDSWNYKPRYMITHVSSSLSLDIPVGGWDILYPENVCLRSSILIPNGISMWHARFDPHGKILEDYLTLTFSIADNTVQRINIRGLLQVIDQMGVLESGKDKSEPISEFRVTNDNIVCALDSSTKFCEKYGQEMQPKTLKDYEEDHEGLVLDKKKLEYFKLARHYNFRGSDAYV